MQHPAMDGRPVSYMIPLGYQNNHCGYCKLKPDKSFSYYARSARGVHPIHYQGLVDRGWRRSGATYYKPDVRHSCCPQYTIRLDGAAFRARKDQRQAVNRFTQYIVGQDYMSLAARLCPKTREEKRRQRNRFDLCEAIHRAEYQAIKRPVNPKTQAPIEPAHKLEISLEPDDFTKEKYALFANYQKNVHKEPPSKASASQFKSWLCYGLDRSTYDQDGKQRKIGSYHQCYRLDGRLIAMGVLDIMPHCVSSVYLMYHSSVSEWEFGKLSALQEAALAVEGGYRYYYMGFYIHSCVKMRYKGTFQPTYVLDPESYAWDLLDQDLLARLSARNYVSLSQERPLGISASSTAAEIRQAEQKAEPSLDSEQQVEGESQSLDLSSIFNLNMPGVMTPEAVISQVAFQDVKILLKGTILDMSSLFEEWTTAEMKTSHSFQGAVAEFVACIGPELAKEIVIDSGH